MRYIFLTLATILLNTVSFTQANAATTTGNTGFFYVINATSGTFDGNTLTLQGVPAVVYFSDTPDKVAGHMTVRGFLDATRDTFTTTPTTGTLTIVTDTGKQNAQVELTDITVNGKTLTSRVKVLKNKVPKTFTNASLFLDPNTVNPTISD